jgi:hypothetical protein
MSTLSPRLTELLEYLTSTRRVLDDAIAAVPASQHVVPSAPDRWSTAEVLEHLVIVEKSVAKNVIRWIDEARAAGVSTEDDPSPLLESMRIDRVKDRSRRIEAPEGTRPSRGLAVAESLALIDEARTRLAAAFTAADGLALGSIVRPHPAMGDLTLYEWLAFAGAHMERHAEQIRELGPR